MSFILDALKKSELERQRQSIPGLMDSGTAQSSRRFPVWAIALGVLLGVNLIVLLFVLTRGGSPAARLMHASGAPAAAQHPAIGGPAAAAGGPAAGERAGPAPADHFSPLDAAPVYAPEIPAAGVPASREPAAAAGNAAVAAGRAANHPPAGGGTANAPGSHPRDPLLSNDDHKSDEESLPSINEINLAGQQALPDLHLDVHVYATQPAERFVYINMRKYHEGATLQEGPILERIRRDGVILNYQGLRFVLPRQQ